MSRACIIFFCLVFCGGISLRAQSGEQHIRVLTLPKALSLEGGVTDFAIEASLPWRIDIDSLPAWVQEVRPFRGDGDASIVVRYLENPHPHVREHKLVIRGEQSGITQTIDLVQPGIYTDKLYIPRWFRSRVFLTPNPVLATLYVWGGEGSVDVTINSLDGKTVRKASFSSGNGVVDVADLMDGVYLVHIRTNSSLEVKRIIKQ